MRILALETSCDETAAAVLDAPGTLLSSEISSQIPLHRPYGGVVPELASRNHTLLVDPVVREALRKAETDISQIDAFAATSGPGLSSSLLVGNTYAKALAVTTGKPFLAINHLEGHLLSPFLGTGHPPQPNLSLIVSGGHTMLLEVRAIADYTLLGRTRDDAAGEAFDKGAKMLGLPYPGGPEIDNFAKQGNPKAYQFPRSMLNRPGHEFSFSGLKTALLYTLEKIPDSERPAQLPDLCASYQEAIVEVLVKKTLKAAKETNQNLITISGGVSLNTRLRTAFQEATKSSGHQLLIADPHLSADNAAMIAYVAACRLPLGHTTELTEDINPNLPLTGVEKNRK